MTQDPQWRVVLGPTQHAARNVKKWRAERGWSQEALAQRIAALGLPRLNRSVLANLEAGRRPDLSVEEVWVLALALDVSPIDLVLPSPEDEELAEEGVSADTVAVFPPDPSGGIRPHPVQQVRSWLKGQHRLPDVADDVDEREFHRKAPRRERAQYEEAFWRHPLSFELENLRLFLRVATLGPLPDEGQGEPRLVADAIRRALEGINFYGERLVKELEEMDSWDEVRNRRAEPWPARPDDGG